MTRTKKVWCPKLPPRTFDEKVTAALLSGNWNKLDELMKGARDCALVELVMGGAQ